MVLTMVTSWTAPFPDGLGSTYRSVQRALLAGSSLRLLASTVLSALPTSDRHTAKTVPADSIVDCHSYSSGPRHGRSSVAFSTYDSRKVRHNDLASSLSSHRPNQTSSGSRSMQSVKNLYCKRQRSAPKRWGSRTYAFQACHARSRLYSVSSLTEDRSAIGFASCRWKIAFALSFLTFR